MNEPVRRPPSGQQYVITHGNLQAQIAQVGATLRTLTLDGLDVIDGFGADERSVDGRGQVLAPWPNRLTDGSYRYGVRDCQAPLNEVEPPRRDPRAGALAGLVARRPEPELGQPVLCAATATGVRVAARPRRHLHA